MEEKNVPVSLPYGYIPEYAVSGKSFTPIEALVWLVSENLKEIAVSECMTKDDYEAVYERVYLDFMAMMDNV